MSDVPTVLAVWPRVILRDLREQGRDTDALVAEAGIDLRAIEREGGRIPYLGQARLIEAAARELGDDCYGLHLVSRVDIRDADALAYIGLASHTLGDALANLARYAQVFNEGVRLELSADGDVAIVEIDAADHAILHLRQQMEFGVGVLIHAYRTFTGRKITPVGVRFVHDRRTLLREVTRFFGCQVDYLQAGVQIILTRSDLAIPIVSADHRLLKILTARCEAVLREHGSGDKGLLQQVESRVIDLLPRGQARAKVIATDIGVSDRTLTRQLAQIGTSFNEIVERLRRQLALEYVTGSDLSLTQVAFLLGYANQPAFSLAFRRWTGKSPSKMRAGSPTQAEPH